MMLRHDWPQGMANGDTVMAWAEVPAAPGQVLAALVTDEIESWWGSAHAGRMTNWIADLRVGGRWSGTIEKADGEHMPLQGVFLEIEASRRIVQTRRYGHPERGGMETRVAFLLEPIDRATRLMICHGGFSGRPEAAKAHVEDWVRALGWLQGHFRGSAAV